MKQIDPRLWRTMGWLGIVFGTFRLGFIAGVYVSQHVGSHLQDENLRVSWASWGIWISLVGISGGIYLLRPNRARRQVPA